MRRNRTGGNAMSDWNKLRGNLDELARVYNVRLALGVTRSESSFLGALLQGASTNYLREIFTKTYRNDCRILTQIRRHFVPPQFHYRGEIHETCIQSSVWLYSCLPRFCEPKPRSNDATKSANHFRKIVAGMQKYPGYFPFYWDSKAGKIWLEIDKWNSEFLYVESLPAGDRLQ
jgi:hypothetical protein